ncbi:Gfo/Idh/MocA family oxidoreductase [Paenibacillus campi]|uniref:Gfo/Idh/MocA family protein n=1 Tax=Paenibacillus campi TaxID=3106031 RepID=UPI002AFEBD51|nr:Gfo/Idh/MocA family oxidoreductase [Paenibacillus sp. SGZ-1014]
MKVAIVGCGTMGRIHAANLAKMPEAELVGAFDVQYAAAQHIADTYGTTAFHDFDVMMKETDPDIVCVLLQTPLHRDYVQQIADYGKHVFCEKPIALQAEEGRAMAAYCEAKGVRLCIGHVLRFFPNYQDMKRRVDGGEIGRVGVVHTKRVGPHPGAASAWYHDFEHSGGVIMDLMIHDIDFLRWTLGEVESVYTINYRNSELDYALVTLQFRNKTIANLEAGWGVPEAFRYGIELAGSKGLLRFDSNSAGSLHIKRAHTPTAGVAEVAVPQSPTYADPYYRELEHFIAAITHGTPLLITAEEACTNIEIVRAAIQSAATGLPIYL